MVLRTYEHLDEAVHRRKAATLTVALEPGNRPNGSSAGAISATNDKGNQAY